MNRSILFATSEEHAGLVDDDLATVPAFRALGADVAPLVWTRMDERALEAAAAVVVRSCWDYHLRPRAFDDWVGRVERAGVPLVNSPRLIRWNMHKGYLLELERAGVPIVPTRLVGAGAAVSLASVVAEHGWTEAVVKPAVSLNGWRTWRTAGGAAGARHADEFDAMIGEADVLIQRYVPEIATSGEWSLVFFGGRFSHAVRKLPAAGEFRVQVEHGGSVRLAEPPAPMVDQALHAIAALPDAPAYVRVDGVVVEDAFLVMEVEAIDPTLHFPLHAPAREAFARAVLEVARP